MMIRVIFLLNFKGIKQLSSSLGDGGEKKNKGWYRYTFKYLEFVGHSINFAKLYICL